MALFSGCSRGYELRCDNVGGRFCIMSVFLFYFSSSSLSANSQGEEALLPRRACEWHP